MRVIPRVLAFASLVLAVLCVVLTTCTNEVQVEEDAGATDEVDAAEPEEEPVVNQKVLTWRDVEQEVQDSLSDAWPEVTEGQMYDTASTLFRYSQERNIDPIIVADEFADLANTILDMQPDFTTGREGGAQRALLVSADIYQGVGEVRGTPCSQLVENFDDDEGQVPRINVYILAAMGYRESRFMKRTEVGYSTTRDGQKVTNCRWCRGSRGEQGMFQFMPGGWIQTFMPAGCSPFDRMCSVRGAAKALATIRCMCIDQYGQRCDVNTFVAGYGANKLPDPANARAYKGVVRAREFLCGVRPDDCDEFWPSDRSEDTVLGVGEE